MPMRNGVQAFSFLRTKFAGNSVAKSLTALSDIFSTKFDSDPLSAAQKIVALNKQLADDERLPDKILSAFILTKLPSTFVTLRDNAIATNSFADPDALIDQIEQLAPFVFKVVSFARGGGPTCFNCNSREHIQRDCTIPRLDCDACGSGAGHLPEHCLVKNGRPIPHSFTAAQRNAITIKRAEWRAKAIKKGANAAEADEDELQAETELASQMNLGGVLANY